VVAGGEESDWLTADAFRLFSRKLVLSDGSGALYLKREAGGSAELRAVTSSHSFTSRRARTRAAGRVRAELPPCATGHLLADGLQSVPHFDLAEVQTWEDWPSDRVSPKKVLGEGLMAASAWQCVAAVDALREGRNPAASVSVVGCNQQAIGAHFTRAN
jgi:hypothetical protein